MIKLSAILITVSAIAKGFCDSIKFHPKTFPFKSDWWFGKGEYAWNNRTWLEENALSFLSDGWHFMDAIRVISILLLVALLYAETRKLKEYDHNKYYADHNIWLIVLSFTVVGYIYHGVIFTIIFWIL